MDRTPLYHRRIMGNDPRQWIKMEIEQKEKERWRCQRAMFSINLQSQFDDSLLVLTSQDKPYRKGVYRDYTRHEMWMTDSQTVIDHLKNLPTLAKLQREEAARDAAKMEDVDELTKQEYLVRQRIGAAVKECHEKMAKLLAKRVKKTRKETRLQERLRFREIMKNTVEKMNSEKGMAIAEAEDLVREVVKKEKEEALEILQRSMDEEVLLAARAKEEYLNSTFAFQLAWQMAHWVEQYKIRMRDYSKKWRDIILNLKKQVEEEEVVKGYQTQTQITQEVIHAVSKTVEEYEAVRERERAAYEEKLTQALEDQTVRDREMVGLIERVSYLEEKLKEWKGVMGEVLDEFNKFVSYSLEQTPGQTNYLLSLSMLDQLRSHHDLAAVGEVNIPEMKSVDEELRELSEPKGEVSQEVPYVCLIRHEKKHVCDEAKRGEAKKPAPSYEKGSSFLRQLEALSDGEMDDPTIRRLKMKAIIVELIHRIIPSPTSSEMEVEKAAGGAEETVKERQADTTKYIRVEEERAVSSELVLKQLTEPDPNVGKVVSVVGETLSLDLSAPPDQVANARIQSIVNILKHHPSLMKVLIKA